MCPNVPEFDRVVCAAPQPTGRGSPMCPAPVATTSGTVTTGQLAPAVQSLATAPGGGFRPAHDNRLPRAGSAAPRLYCSSAQTECPSTSSTCTSTPASAGGRETFGPVRSNLTRARRERRGPTWWHWRAGRPSPFRGSPHRPELPGSIGRRRRRAVAEQQLRGERVRRGVCRMAVDRVLSEAG